jgi:type IV pilus assembly protein PilY1
VQAKILQSFSFKLFTDISLTDLLTVASFLLHIQQEKIVNSKNKILSAAIAFSSIALVLITVFAADSFNPELQPIGYVAQPAASSPMVVSGNEKLYAVDYNSQDWSGNLHSYPLSSTASIGDIDAWGGGAAAQIDLQDFNTGRKIVTWNGTAGIAFRWASLSTGTSSQQTDLGTSSVLDYIRGDISNQNPNGLKYRSRTTVLGDIIHSTPVHWSDGTNKTVFVGANDGMLHAINAEDGTERFAYIPSLLIPKLPALTNISYAHKYYVDGRLDVHKFGSQTILAGALGAGGKGLFGLDVTNSAATSEADAASKVLWEITNTKTGFENLGYTYGAPTLLTLPNGSSALVVGNGYNNSGNGHASLFLINASTGALIQELDTGSGSNTSPNGLSSPSLVDTDGDGKSDIAYAGDIDGHLWKFSLVSPYTVTLLHTTSPAQAITMAPGIKTHPLGGRMVTFVTGRMLTDTDITDSTVHSAYGIWDGAPPANTELLSQTLTEANYTGVTPPIRVRTASSTVPDTVPNWNLHKGWKTALPIGGERVVGDGAYVTGSVFLFMTTNPTISPTAKPPGENWWMQLNALTGGDSNTVLFDLNKDGAFTSSDQVSNNRNPVGRNMGGGIRSQLIALSASGYDVYQSNYDKNGSPPTVTTTTTGSRGVSGGHFDFDIFCATNCKTTTGASAGQYYTGTDAKGFFYTHVHEYDDIYDVTGVDILNPSQSLDKLSRVKVNSTTTTTSTSTSTTGPTVVVGTKATLSSSTVTGLSSASNPSTTAVVNTINTTPAPVTGYPATTSSGSSTTVTTKSSFDTTETTVKNSNVTGTKSKGYKYDQTTTIKKWITTTTSTSTTTTTSTTATTVIPLPTSTGFKVLIANQAYSPAAKVSIGGADYVSAYGYQAASGLTAASIPTYTLANVGTLKFNLPLDAFKSKDWGTGIVRAGLHPIKWSCAVKDAIDGPIGEWRNGALTVQVVDATITDSDIQLNVQARPELGYRLSTAGKTKLIAEYTTFWHHPNDKCMGDSGWTMSPPEDTSPSDAKAATPATGSTDPREGTFGVNGTTTGAAAGTVTTKVTNADGSVTTTVAVTVSNADGTTTTTSTSTTTGATSGIDTGGAVNSGGVINTDGTDTRARTAAVGRINWRELQR